MAGGTFTALDPANLMLGLGALAAIGAGAFWWRFALLAQTVTAPEGWLARNRLGHAATLTGVALVLSGAGYLLGRFAGSF